MNFKYYFFALAMVGGLLFSACEPKENTMPVKHLSKPDSVYVYQMEADGTEKLSSIVFYTYDAAMNNTVVFKTLVSPDYYVQVTKNRTEMQYNSKGLMTMKIDSWYYIDKAAWRDVECRVYSYDDNSRLTTEYEYPRYSNPLPKVNYKLFYTWTDGTHAEVIGYNCMLEPNDTTGVATQRLVNTYTSEGKIENQKFYWLMYPNPNNTPDFEYELTYDQYENLVCLNTISHSRGMPSSREYNKYEYDEQGNILVKWNYTSYGEDDNYVLSAKYVYFY